MLKEVLTRRFTLPVIALLGAIIAIIVINSQSGVERVVDQHTSKTVDFIHAQVVPFRARSLGYGSVEAATFLEANAEVSGRVIYLNPDLKRGASVSMGELALRIDPTNYELALAKAEADLVINQASLEELAIEKEKVEISLAIAMRNLSIGEKELHRKRSLMTQGSLSSSAVDIEEQKVLGLKQSTQELKSQVALIPTRTKVIFAQIARAKAQLKEQEKNLGRTEVVFPFNARVGQVFVEQDEFVAANSKLFNAGDISRVEISAELPISKVRPLIMGAAPQMPPMTNDPSLTKQLFERLKLDVSVRLVGSQSPERWQARAIRIGETLDPTSRTIAFIVAIDHPYANVIPGKRPPLLPGMYMEVELIGQPVPRLTVPRHAIHQGNVYVVSANNTLGIQKVNIDFMQGDLAVIESGVNEGDRIIVNDLIPAIGGMALTAKHDTKLQETILSLANGQGSLK